jgi:hypothetical protein
MTWRHGHDMLVPASGNARPIWRAPRESRPGDDGWWPTGSLICSILQPRPHADREGGVTVKITLGEWQDIGKVGSEADHGLILPQPPSGPGIYRIQLFGGDPTLYVGETADLPRRFQGYRTPGSSQMTKKRMHEEMLAALRNDQHVPVEICVSAEVEVGTCHEALDLRIKSHRRLAEDAALAEARAAGFGRVENVGR